jgi:lipoate-protein ligase A
MALDHALMDRARRTGESVVRVYSWSAPVLSFGRNQRARGHYLPDELAGRGIGVVRRPTGGRALLHHREITYSVTAPAPASDSLPAAYERVNTLLLEALAALGVMAAPAQPSGRAVSPSELPCFAEPARGEIVANGGKLVGSAQWREGGALLQHGSIIVDDDQTLIPALMHTPPPSTPAPATLREVLGRAPSAKEFAEALFDVVRQRADRSASALEQGEIDQLALAPLLEHYRNAEWIWRR